MQTSSRESPVSNDHAAWTRRTFLNRLSLALGALGAAVLGLPIVGFLFSPLLRRPPQIWRGVGPINQFQIGTTVQVTFPDASPLPWAGVAAQTAAWLRRVDEQTFIAFSINCTHLGCPVRWLTEAKMFMCPCHGGVYYQNGEVAAGPPLAPLARYSVRVHESQVEILTSPLPFRGQAG